MDTFMDKLAQRLNAQEMIKANTSAEAKETTRLKEQNAMYEALMQKVQENSAQSESAVSKLEQGAANIVESAGKLDQGALNITESAGKVEQGALKVFESADKVEQGAFNVTESAGKVEQGALKVFESAEKLEQNAARVDELINAALAKVQEIQQGGGELGILLLQVVRQHVRQLLFFRQLTGNMAGNGRRPCGGPHSLRLEAILRYREHSPGILGVGAVNMAEHHIGDLNQSVGHLGGELLIVALLQHIEQNVQGVDDQLLVQHRQYTGGGHPIIPYVGIVVGDLLYGDHSAGFIRGTAQQIIAGNAVIIGGSHHEIQSALTDALFVVGQERLGNMQVRSGLFLADAALFTQQNHHTGECGIHGRYLLSKLPPS